SKTGPGRMPHLGSEIVDGRGVEVVHGWIRSLPTTGEGDPLEPHRAELAALDSLLAFKGRDAAKNPDLERLLSSTSGALILARALDNKSVPPELRPAVVAVAAARPESEIRDLFERFLPADQRTVR